MENSKSPSDVWHDLLNTEGHEQKAQPLTWWSGGLILATLSASNAPEMVIEISGLEIEPGKRWSSALNVSGLELFYENLAINNESKACLILKPKKEGQYEVFFAVADFLVEKISTNTELKATPDTLETVIRKWIEFWSRERAASSREKVLGLIGELLALESWVDLSEKTHSVWQGPLGDPQDFRGQVDALEVKVSGTRTGPLVHKISSLKQLQIPESGKLHVLSFRIGLGEVGSRSLDELVKAIRELGIFQSKQGREHLELALEAAGYNDQLPLEFSKFDVHESQLFQIKEDFPRLIESDLPEDPRIFDISYSVDFSSAAEFLVATKPQLVQLA